VALAQPKCGASSDAGRTRSSRPCGVVGTARGAARVIGTAWDAGEVDGADDEGVAECQAV
jgi:hypothetical protein